ncbi:heterokaryon incompatibility protein-domain-containing protein [Cubamyces lactineus]|nr:heterokaryon incompatibility protein-domain-containing protein [Cubamyces lactineus]
MSPRLDRKRHDLCSRRQHVSLARQMVAVRSPAARVVLHVNSPTTKGKISTLQCTFISCLFEHLAAAFGASARRSAPSTSVSSALMPSQLIPKPLPPRPSSIYSACWKGPFATQLGLLGQPIEDHPHDHSADSWSWSGGYTYHVSPQALLFRATFGCEWCGFLMKQLGARTLKSNMWRPITRCRRPLNVRIGGVLETESGDPAALCIVVDNGINLYDGPVRLYDKLSTYTTADDPAARYVHGRARRTDVGSDRTFALAMECIERCVREHERCRVISSSHPNTLVGRAPTRLIDCTEPQQPRIVLTNGALRDYVALSYVWGEDQPHRTTKANLSSYMVGINPSDLPQTIRDAIYVAHKLGVGFLWTGSLCIVQDSPQDKHRELALMCDVYRHAYLTIDAASAAKASDGFLQDRPPLEPPMLILPFICPGGPPNAVAEVGKIHIPGSKYNASPSLDRLSLTTRQRAWCLQEKLLSTRSLVFTQETVRLACQTMTQNIGGAWHNDVDEVPRLPDSVFHPGRRPIERYSDEWMDVRRRWHAVVRDYASRELSYPSDKLVACAGLVEMFAAALGSVYVAGLWNDDFLLLDLLWHCKLALPAPPGYRAPSWSWASAMHLLVEYRDPARPETAFRRGKMAEVVSCTIAVQDESFPLGPVTSGLLVLRAQLFKCKLQEERSAKEVYVECGSIQVRLDSHLDRELEKTYPDGVWAVPIRRNVQSEEDPEDVSESSTTLCAGLLLADHVEADSDNGGGGLDNRNLRLFRRVGYFEVEHWRHRDMQSLGWDGEWSLETAAQFGIV